MSSLSSPIVDRVVENIMEEVQRERAEQPENRETTPTEEIREETEEVEVEAREVRVFFTKKGAVVFRKNLAKKGFIEKSGFRKLVPPFKEEVERRG